MEKATLKIKPNGKHKIKFVGQKDANLQKEFILDGFEVGNYECQVEKDSDGKIIEISVNGNSVKKDNTIAKKAAAAKLRKQIQNEKDEDLRKRKAKAKDEFDKLKIPSDTKDALIGATPDNPVLVLNKLVYFKLDLKDNIEKVVKGKDFGDRLLFDTEFIKLIAKKHKAHISKILPESNLEELIFKPDWRTIVGLGGASVYETSITLHHLYGFPYIPASSIKGVVRSYVIQKHFMQKYGESDEKAGEKAEKDALNDDEFVLIFGSQKKQGKVIFFDAFPIDKVKIVADVMTPHYPDWYGEGKAPTDTQSPVPIPFLTVKDTTFQFLFGAKKVKAEELRVANKTLADWLDKALTHQGIGAKTAVGYGRMQKKQ